MKTTTRLLVLTLVPLFSSMLLICIIVYLVMHGDIARQKDKVRLNQEEIIKKGLKGRVDTAWSFIEDCFNRGISQEECKAYMAAVRFGENNYIWLHRLDPADVGRIFMLVHPATSLVNRDLTGSTDFDQFKSVYYRGQIYEKDDPSIAHIRPIQVYRQLNTVCLQQGEGVVEYYWPKVMGGETGEIGYHKISYVRLFKPWNWVVGAGQYADYIDMLVSSQNQQINQAVEKIYMTLVYVFAGVAVFFGLVVSVFSKKVASRLDRSKQKLLDSKQKLRLSEKRLLDIAFCSADFIWEVDRKGNYCFVAGNTDGILGYAPTELVGKNPYTFMVEQDRAKAENDYRKLADEKKPIKDHKVRYRCKTGEIVFFLRNASPMVDGAGRLTGYRGVDQDITDSIREEEKRTILEKELQVSQKLEAVGNLAAGIAHEINTPIQFIGDNTTFLSDSMKDLFNGFNSLKEMVIMLDDGTGSLKKRIHGIEEACDLEFLETEIPQALDQSREGVDRVSAIVRTMKDFSHMGCGSLAEADINKAIETTIIISQNEWKYVAEMKTDLDSALPPVGCFIGDIKQVILNLILNAAHTIQDALAARKEPLGCITIRTYVHGTYAVLEIADTGMGIDDKDRDRVFEHFFTTKDVGRGTGQGLSMAYHTIVEKHKGEIGFTTELGKGTTFCIKIPIIPDPEPECRPQWEPSDGEMDAKN
ncbi:MAG: PAS domain S-box protein [Desulfobacterium sp.]|nr:PAS domain S-box protein [Desulfobacterium sp.]